MPAISLGCKDIVGISSDQDEHLKFVLTELLVMVCTFLLYESFTKTVLGLLFKYKYLKCG